MKKLMRKENIVKVVFILAVMLIFMAASTMAKAATIEQYGGTHTDWPDDPEWAPLNSLNDPSDAAAQDWLDFVGDSSDPGAYFYAKTGADDGAGIGRGAGEVSQALSVTGESV